MIAEQLYFSAPDIILVPSLRAAMESGYKSSPAGLARRILDDNKFITMLGDMPRTRLLPDGRIVPRAPETSWWLTDRQVFYGNINLRHELTSETEKFGGHIGYSVHPHYYNQGIGYKLLQHGLVEARNIGLSQVLLTIDDDNIASIKVAEKCGACLQDVIDNPQKPDTPHRRYWIKL